MSHKSARWCSPHSYSTCRLISHNSIGVHVYCIELVTIGYSFDVRDDIAIENYASLQTKGKREEFLNLSNSFVLQDLIICLLYFNY